MMFSIQWFDKIDSTNAYLKSRAECFPTGQVIAAGEQSAGRGRLGRQFVSPPDGLYFSLLLRPSALSQALFIPLLGGMAVAAVLSEQYGISAFLKWPNDVLINRKKVCGILAETAAENAVVLGIGLNISVAADYFIQQNLPHASSIETETGCRPDKATLLNAVLRAYERLSAAPREAVMERYRELCVTLGKAVTTTDGLSGTAVDIDEKGQLVLQDSLGNLHSLNSGEVSIQGMY